MTETPASPYEVYTALVSDHDLPAAMAGQLDELLGLLRATPEAEAGKKHPPYTWTVRQVVGHLIDAERVFGYRAMRLARGDATPLPGFDENPYVTAGGFDDRTLADLTDEFELLRRSHVLMFRNLPQEAWSRRGTVSNTDVSVLDLAKVIVGHVRHHAAILRKRLTPS